MAATLVRATSEEGLAGMVAGVSGAPIDSAEQQRVWSAQRISTRVNVLRRVRLLIAARASEFCAAISPMLARNAADTRAAEVLPLLDACKFLECNAAAILATRRLGRRGRPIWLAGVDSEVQRASLGQVLIIAPANYPLLLAGVQTLQAVVAGNSVVWKPGRGGRAVALAFAQAIREAGLPDGLLTVTDESVEAGQAAIAGLANGVKPAKIVFTGSAAAGRAVLRMAAETATPCVMELSGCDAVVVLPSASIVRVAKALAFGMRLNGSATCLAPRRVVVVGDPTELTAQLQAHLEKVPGARLPHTVTQQLTKLLDNAVRLGADVEGKVDEGGQRPIVVTKVTADMELAQADVFAPVLSLLQVQTVDRAVEAVEACGYGLTAAIFGEEREARALAARLTVGTVLINDLIVPTADARVPFGGRKGSGFGTTRGAEGLLEMTAAKVVSVRRGGSARHYEATGKGHEALFDGMILMLHGAGWRERWDGMRRLVRAAREMK